MLQVDDENDDADDDHEDAQNTLSTGGARGL